MAITVITIKYKYIDTSVKAFKIGSVTINTSINGDILNKFHSRTNCNLCDSCGCSIRLVR